MQALYPLTPYYFRHQPLGEGCALYCNMGLVIVPGGYGALVNETKLWQESGGHRGRAEALASLSGS